ncbi:hypothetical protein Clacol_001506 [Clathrus columnatus]|uniref:Uncharacterized protein n=1 Tax=Clathrus columnatus TaxID=1419009 RepID=A0AAV4ZZE9_9AGAM|nr:hypothetical protein Clacol_001506 [Clathrus columnatus]
MLLLRWKRLRGVSHLDLAQEFETDLIKSALPIPWLIQRRRSDGPASSLKFSSVVVAGRDLFGIGTDRQVTSGNPQYNAILTHPSEAVFALHVNRDVFLRELISNANDALEKLRITALTNKDISIDSPLNITIKALKEVDGSSGRIVITDYGIGMSPEELSTNLGTLAKSGTTEFLARAESLDGTGQGNLIGAFGLGFYSSFLVADQVYVASIPPKSAQNPNPQQYVFSSNAEDSSFELYPDPRGNTLGRGTEVTLIIKEDAGEFLNVELLKRLVSFPLYILTTQTVEVPDEDETEPVTAEGDAPVVNEPNEIDEEEIDIEDADEKLESNTPKFKTIITETWERLNNQPPIWTRDPKEITNEEYIEFYKATFKDKNDPLAWHHFKGDVGTGTSFKAILFVPSQLPRDFWQAPTTGKQDIRLYNKRVFITNDLEEDGLLKWVSWLKVIIDADDLPLNVSRETLQSSRFLRQIKQVLIRRLIQLLQRISDEDPAKYEDIIKVLGNTLKLGMIESRQESEKIGPLLRFATNQKNVTSLNDYITNRKKGQTQIFYLAAAGQSTEILKKSLFVEKLSARGYEVILAVDPLDDILFTSFNRWKDMTFQDISKTGLKFGDEDSEEESEQETLKEKFEPLLIWLKKHVPDTIMEVTISNRLVSSPCAVVAQDFGYSANMERIMNAQSTTKQSAMHELAKKFKNLEVNPHSLLIQGMLRRVERLPGPDDEPDEEAEAELKEVTAILIDGALVRSGYDVSDANLFFERVERVLRRSIGISETAKADVVIKPAPPVETGAEAFSAEDDSEPFIRIPEELQGKVNIEMEELPDDFELSSEEESVYHDEL